MIRENVIDRKLNALGNFGMAIWKGWPLWTMLFDAVLPILISELRREERVLVLGVCYQLAGLITILLGINSKLEFANRLSWQMLSNWMKEIRYALRVLFIGHKTIYGNMHSIEAGDSSIGFGVLRARVDHSNLPLQEQIAHLWKEHYQLEERLDKVDAVHRESARKLESQIEAQKLELIEKIKEQREELNKFLSEDYKTELAGALLVTVGMIFSSLPKVVSTWCS